MQKINILIIGGTGFIGSVLANTLLTNGHVVSVLSRSPAPESFSRNGINTIQADVLQSGKWQKKINQFEVVINLTGLSIFRRWTRGGKKEILDSRILTTRNIVDALILNKGTVQTFINVSGVGYYGFHKEEILTETGLEGSDFIAQVAARWEGEAEAVMECGIRLAICRFGHVLGIYGGILPKLSILARLHLASYWGSGNQWISWIHEKDLANAILFIINDQNIKGPVNICSPNPVRNREMMYLLSKIINKQVLIPPIPAFALQIMLGQFSSVFVKGQRVIPEILMDKGFNFKYPDLDQALIDLLKST